jgi:hypothetical protein
MAISRLRSRGAATYAPSRGELVDDLVFEFALSMNEDHRVIYPAYSSRIPTLSGPGGAHRCERLIPRRGSTLSTMQDTPPGLLGSTITLKSLRVFSIAVYRPHP